MYTKIEMMEKDEIVKLNLSTLSYLYYYPARHKKFDSIFNGIRSFLGDKFKSDLYDPEIWMIVKMLTSSLKVNKKGCWFPRKYDTYVEFNKTSRNKMKLSRDRICFILDYMEKLGHIDMYVGCKNWSHESDYDESITSRVIFKESMIGLVENDMLDSVKSPYDSLPILEIKKGKDKKPLKNISKFKGVNLKKNNIKRYNEFLKDQVISLFGETHNLHFKRIFIEDLHGCGRWFDCGKFQTLKKGLRKSIKINGNKTTEVDLKSLHTNLIATLLGIDLQGKDPYKVYDPELVEWVGGLDNLRSLSKLAMMCIINCKTKHGSKKALYNSYEKERNDFDSIMFNLEDNKDKFDKIIDMLLEHNKELVFFGKGSYDYKILQNIDSDICEVVLMKCMNRGFLALPYHDSWVCEHSRQEDLIQILKEAWFSVLGVMLNFNYKIEY